MRIVQAYTELPPELCECKDSVERWSSLHGVRLIVLELEFPFRVTNPGIASDFVRVKELSVPDTLWLDWDVYIASLPPLNPNRSFRAGEWIIWNGGQTDVFSAAMHKYIEHISRFPNSKNERFRMLKCLEESGFYDIPEIQRSTNYHLFRGSQR